MSSGSGFHNTAVVECVSKVIGQIPDHSYLSVSLCRPLYRRTEEV